MFCYSRWIGTRISSFCLQCKLFFYQKYIKGKFAGKDSRVRDEPQVMQQWHNTDMRQFERFVIQNFTAVCTWADQNGFDFFASLKDTVPVIGEMNRREADVVRTRSRSCFAWTWSSRTPRWDKRLMTPDDVGSLVHSAGYAMGANNFLVGSHAYHVVITCLSSLPIPEFCPEALRLRMTCVHWQAPPNGVWPKIHNTLCRREHPIQFFRDYMKLPNLIDTGSIFS